MKRIASIFIALSLCTLPAFGVNPVQYCKNNTGSARLDCEGLTFTCSNGLKDNITVNSVLNANCKESLRKKLGQNCNAANAKKATWSSIKENILCIPQSCECGYEIRNLECKKWANPAPTCIAKNAQTAHTECKNGKEVCIIDTCKKDTPVLNTEKNKCEKCPQGQEPDGQGQCKTTPTTQKPAEQVAPQSTSGPATKTEPALHSDCTEQIDNAARAIYTKKDKKIVCTLKECKCGYEIQEDKCVPWGENPPKCKITNAQTAHKECKNGKEVCIIDTCKKDTPVLNTEKTKCEKCPQGQEPDGQGQCKTTAVQQKKEDKESAIKDLLLVTCEEVNNERGTVSANCTNGKITVKCAGAKTGGTVNNQEHGEVICPNTKSNITFNIEVIESKEVTNAKDRETCEKQGNKGEWKSNRCVCNNKDDIFDEKKGCIAETAATTDAKKDLESLGTALTNALNKIKAAEEQK